MVKCPNCGYTLSVDNMNNNVHCEACMSVFSMHEYNLLREGRRITEQGEEEIPKARSESGRRRVGCLMDIVQDKIYALNSDFLVSEDIVWKEVLENLYGNRTIEGLEQELYQAAETRDDCCAGTWNTALKGRVTARIQSYFRGNEDIVFYKDEGLFSRAKAGVCLTQKRIIFVKKRKIECKEYAAIRRVEKTYGTTWMLNSDYSLLLNTVGCTEKTLGIMLAYILTRSAMERDSSQKIVIGN